MQRENALAFILASALCFAADCLAVKMHTLYKAPAVVEVKIARLAN